MTAGDLIKKNIREFPDFPQKGILFKDITPIFLNQELCNLITEEFIRLLPEKPGAIVGIESRGFLFGFLMANRLGIPFVLIRKSGKLPGKSYRVQYDLEYGTSAVEIQEGILEQGTSVVIHDDLLATGGTAAASAELIQKAGLRLSSFTFLIELTELKGREKLHKFTNHTICLAKY